MVFSDDGTALASKWEHSVNGGGWNTFWDVEARKQV
jgi:hypothetical protein